jgi:hypothetical protein
MTIWPVSPKLNAVKNDAPDLMEPIEEKEPKANEVVSIGDYWLRTFPQAPSSRCLVQHFDG